MTVQMPTAQTPPDFGPSTEQLDTAQNRDALSPGTMLGGHQIVDVLAADDFGIVYLALDQSLQRQVAIKEYLPSMLARRRADLNVALRAGEYAPAFNEGLRAFIRESETLSRINHPSLLDVTRSWETHGTAYRMMPFYSGQPISEVLPTLAQPPDEPWLRRLLADLLGALQTLHTAGWQHLNVSPQRILLQADGRPLLLGLGSVRRAIEARKPASIRLEPAPFAFDYAPPEVLDPHGAPSAIGPWSDLFSLAAVFHHMIVGRAPTPAPLRMRGDRMPPLATTVLTLAVNYPSLVYSLELTGTLTRALALNPGDRPQSVAAFLNALDTPAPRTSPGAAAFDPRVEPRFEPAEPRETSSVEPVPRRRGALRWALPLVVLAAVGGGAWHWHESGGQLPSVDSLGMAAVTPAATPPARPVAQPATPAPVEIEVESPAAPTAQASAVQAAPVAGVVMNEPSPQQVAAAPAAPPPPPPAPVVAPAPVVTPAPTRAAAPAPRPAPRPATPERAPVRTAAAPAEPDNPRAVCGPRSNFSLTYCMETQCKRPRFQRHPQCIVLRERGEIR